MRRPRCIDIDCMDLAQFQADSDLVAKSMPNWVCRRLVQPLMSGTATPYCGIIYIGWLGSDWIY